MKSNFIRKIRKSIGYSKNRLAGELECSSQAFAYVEGESESIKWDLLQNLRDIAINSGKITGDEFFKVLREEIEK